MNQSKTKLTYALLTIIALLVIIIFCLAFVFIIDPASKTALPTEAGARASSGWVHLAQGAIPSAIVSLAAVVFVYFRWLRGLTPEHEIKKAIRYSNFIEEIKGGVESLERQLKTSTKPDLIIAFNRTGAIAASMLAGQVDFNIEQVLAIPRKKRVPATLTSRYIYGEPIRAYDREWFAHHKIIVVQLLVDTWKTIGEGLEHLESKGIDLRHSKLSVYSVFVTKKAIDRTPEQIDLKYAYIDENAEAKLNYLPWVIREYGYV